MYWYRLLCASAAAVATAARRDDDPCVYATSIKMTRAIGFRLTLLGSAAAAALSIFFEAHHAEERLTLEQECRLDKAFVVSWRLL